MNARNGASVYGAPRKNAVGKNEKASVAALAVPVSANFSAMR